MMIFSWNIRGLNSQSRQIIVRSWVVSNKLLVGSFLEIHVEKENAATVLASTLPGWRMDNNYWCSEMGRIWLVWDPSVYVLVFKKLQQMILCSLKVSGTYKISAAAFVYEKNNEVERRVFWDEISSLAITSPFNKTLWVILGDLNQILTTAE